MIKDRATLCVVSDCHRHKTRVKVHEYCSLEANMLPPNIHLISYTIRTKSENPIPNWENDTLHRHSLDSRMRAVQV